MLWCYRKTAATTSVVVMAVVVSVLIAPVRHNLAVVAAAAALKSTLHLHGLSRLKVLIIDEELTVAVSADIIPSFLWFFSVR